MGLLKAVLGETRRRGFRRGFDLKEKVKYAFFKKVRPQTDRTASPQSVTRTRPLAAP